MKKIIKGLIFIFTFGAILTSCQKTPQEKAQHMVKLASHKLDLNSEQEEKLVQFKNTVMEVRQRRLKDKNTFRNKIKEIISKDKLNKEDIKNLINKKEKIIEEEFPILFSSLQNFHSSLSLDQKQRIIELIDKCHNKGSCPLRR